VTGGAFVVTGGAGALGRAVVRSLIARGDRVAVPYRSTSDWEALRNETAPSGALWGQAADLTDLAATEQFLSDAVAFLGKLDGVAALAGAYAGGSPLEQAPASDWTSMISVNLFTAYAVCRAALPHLLPKGGSVVTVSSRLAQEGGAGSAAYAVSKAGVLAMTRALALENKERGVRFNCVLPGTIDTPANRRAMPAADFTRWTRAESIARVVAFLLSPESAPVSGAAVPVDAPA
jgi:NAD(P)-dependent dehydrogenase (short-subunit alcohol dehydrogenase family)